tara:strand:+ start:163 stop:363 length:201 start_codon:yes stop_codon:yes gene_type:complete
MITTLEEENSKMRNQLHDLGINEQTNEVMKTAEKLRCEIDSTSNIAVNAVNVTTTTTTTAAATLPL